MLNLTKTFSKLFEQKLILFTTSGFVNPPIITCALFLSIVETCNARWQVFTKTTKVWYAFVAKENMTMSKCMDRALQGGGHGDFIWVCTARSVAFATRAPLSHGCHRGTISTWNQTKWYYRNAQEKVSFLNWVILPTNKSASFFFAASPRRYHEMHIIIDVVNIRDRLYTSLKNVVLLENIIFTMSMFFALIDNG